MPRSPKAEMIPSALVSMRGTICDVAGLQLARFLRAWCDRLRRDEALDNAVMGHRRGPKLSHTRAAEQKRLGRCGEEEATLEAQWPTQKSSGP
jgi:hypothetical protein